MSGSMLSRHSRGGGDCLAIRGDKLSRVHSDDLRVPCLAGDPDILTIKTRLFRNNTQGLTNLIFILS